MVHLEAATDLQSVKWIQARMTGQSECGVIARVSTEEGAGKPWWRDETKWLMADVEWLSASCGGGGGVMHWAGPWSEPSVPESAFQSPHLLPTDSKRGGREVSVRPGGKWLLLERHTEIRWRESKQQGVASREMKEGKDGGWIKKVKNSVTEIEHFLNPAPKQICPVMDHIHMAPIFLWRHARNGKLIMLYCCVMVASRINVGNHFFSRPQVVKTLEENHNGCIQAYKLTKR